jgi:hypothetical protein
MFKTARLATCPQIPVEQMLTAAQAAVAAYGCGWLGHTVAARCLTAAGDAVPILKSADL